MLIFLFVAFFVLTALPGLCMAQNDVVSAGGHNQNAAASVSYSFGQFAAIWLDNAIKCKTQVNDSSITRSK